MKSVWVPTNPYDTKYPGIKFQHKRDGWNECKKALSEAIVIRVEQLGEYALGHDLEIMHIEWEKFREDLFGE